jgi:hypothetical protein
LPKLMLHKGHASSLPKMSLKSKRYWFGPNFIMKVKKKKSSQEARLS